jgi:hypothetical protein
MSELTSDSAVRAGARDQADCMAAILSELNSPLQKMDGTGKPRLSELPQLKAELKSLNFAPSPALPECRCELAAASVAPPAEPGSKAGRSADLEKTSRASVINRVAPEDLKQLDLLRLELAVSTGSKEREAKQSDLSGFVRQKLGDKLSEQELKAITSPQPVADLLSEVKSAGPALTAELIKQARAELVTNAEHAITNGAKLKRFNERLADFDTRAAARGLSESEVLATYLQINRVLDPAMKLEHGDKSLLAGSMIANAADPTTIDQGGHNTCNVTTVQSRLYTREPGLASKVVADVACGGQFVTADGTVIRPRSLDPDSEAKSDPTWDGARNYASQIFQLTAINAYWNRKDTMPGGAKVGKGNILYDQGSEGEFLLDLSKNPPQKLRFDRLEAGNPWLDLYGISEVNQQLTGRPSKDFGMERYFYPSQSDGVSKILTLNGFKERLGELKKENALPVIVQVDASKKPFGDGKGFGPHVVTITDYDPEKGLVTVDNQWGKSDDLTDLPGQGKRPTAELLWSSMNQMPNMDFYWTSIKDGLKDVKVKDSIRPTVTALSTQAFLWGASAAAPVAVRSGLGYLSEWGVPGAGRLLSASETKLGSAALRAGTGLVTFAAFAYANDLPGAFQKGTAHGVGRLTRVTGDFASFEIGRQVSDKALKAVGLWAPARIAVDVAAGMATATVFDRLLGENSEVGGAEAYEKVRELLKPRPQLSAPEKAIKSAPASPLACRSELPLTPSGNKTLQAYLLNQQRK